MKDKQVENYLENSLLCFLDGDHLCIVNSNFVDIQESEATFIKLNSSLISEIMAKEVIECNIQTRKKEKRKKEIEACKKWMRRDYE